MGPVGNFGTALSCVPPPYIMISMKKQPEPLDLEQVILQFRPIVSFRVKRALGGSCPDWEDVVQEILSQAVQKISSGEFRGESSIGTFIYTITSRRIVDFIRQKTRVLRDIPEPASPPDPCLDVESGERSRILADAIQRLKPKFREILYYYYYKEMSREEVAEKLGISPRRVSERLHYAQKLLRKLIKR